MSHNPETEAPSRSAIEDRALVERALQGDQSAFQALKSKYDRALYHHVARMVRSRNEVDDLVQEIFIKAFLAIESYSTQYAFSTWIYKIATNHAIDYLRKKKLPTLSIDKPIQTKDGELEFELPDTTYRPDRHIVTDQRINSFRKPSMPCPKVLPGHRDAASTGKVLRGDRRGTRPPTRHRQGSHLPRPRPPQQVPERQEGKSVGSSTWEVGTG
jgi:RNA polymerase sigma factor (sigma-70 family)